jgi:hypothetical protein
MLAIQNSNANARYSNTDNQRLSRNSSDAGTQHRKELRVRKVQQHHAELRSQDDRLVPWMASS